MRDGSFRERCDVSGERGLPALLRGFAATAGNLRLALGESLGVVGRPNLR